MTAVRREGTPPHRLAETAEVPMLSAIWKIAALFGVIGVGCFVVLEVHKRLPEQTGNAASVDDFQSLDRAGADESDGQPHPAQSDEFSAGSFAEAGDAYADPFGGDAQYEPTGAPTPDTSGTDNWLLANDEPEDISAADSSAPRDADFAAGDWQSMETNAATSPRELPQEFTDVADSDDPFAATADPASSAARLQPLGTGEAGPGLAMPTEDPSPNRDPAVVTAAADGSLNGAVIPASSEEPGGASVAFDPFSGDEGSTAASTEADNPAEPSEFPGEPAPFDPFGGEPSSATAEQPAPEADPFSGAELSDDGDAEVVMPADFDEAGLNETTPRPQLPDVEQDPFSGSTSREDSSAQDPSAAPAAFDPFGGSGNASDPQQGGGDFGAESSSASDYEPNTALPGEQPLNPTFADSPAAAGEPAAPFTLEEDDGPPAMRTAAPAADFAPQIDAAIPDARPARPDYVGDATLDANVPAGPQQPELTVEKVAPPEATVGEPLIYAIKVKNVGSSAAHDVIVEDRIPRGTTLEGTIPQAELSDKRLVWRLGTMEPDQEQTIRIKVVPTDSGEIGSVATVRFVAEVAATTRITTPSLTLDMTGPNEVAVGEQATYRFTVTNNGETDARNVFVRNLLPAGLEHPGGDDIEYEVGTLPAGESRSVELTVTGAEAGQYQSKGLVSTGSTTRSESAVDVNVIGARLLIQRQGPKRRFIGSTADYMTHVSNRSSETLRQITVVEQVPDGLELAGVPEGGQFDAQRRTITRQIAELAPGETTTFQTSLMARDQGTWNGVVRATDATGNKASVTAPLEVAGFPSLAFDVEHAGRPVSVGERVALRLVVKNRGTGAAEDVQALFEIPDNLTFVNAEGPVSFEIEGRFVRFAALDAIEADGEESFDIILTAADSGTTRVSAQLLTPDLAEPLRHDEAVVVQADGR